MAAAFDSGAFYAGAFEVGSVGPVTHDTSGTLTGPGSAVVGAASNFTVHATSGVLAGQTATITGAADREAAAIPHTTTGALTGAGSTVTGTANRFRAHATSGVLPGSTATIAGDADHEALIVPHVASGVLTGSGSSLSGSAFVSHLHATSGELAGPGAEVIGDAELTPYVPAVHDTSSDLVADGAIVSGFASIISLAPTGGGPGNAQKGKSKGWANERRQFELSQQVQQAKQTLAKSEVKAARRLAAKLEDYTLEIVDFKKLQYEFAKLEAQYNNSEQMAADMREAAQAVKQFLQDEQDAIDLLILSEDFDARCVITATTKPFNW